MKKQIIYTTIAFLLITILPNFVLAEDPHVCCERLITGQWCQNAPLSECSKENNYKTTITACDSSTMCQTGTCWNKNVGTCEEGVPQKTCNVGGGVWSEKEAKDLPQCQLGCCVNTGNIVTATRCSDLSKDYGVEVDFRLDIKTDSECRFIKGKDELGACVLETETRRTCSLLTREECDAQDNQGFYAGYLCSDDTVVNTDCGPSTKTTCVEGDDAVYFVDTCGNLANVYDSTKQNNPEYWSRIIPKSESCGWNSQIGNTNSPSCGNCDSFAPTGSTCREYIRGETATPTMGDYICKDMGCSFDTNQNGHIDGDSERYGHGDAWCAPLQGVNVIKPNLNVPGEYNPAPDYTKTNFPGSDYALYKCFDNEVTIEYCAEGRQEICVETEINGYKNALCKPNLWRDCVEQVNKEDCENFEQRDCKWYPINNPSSKDMQNLFKYIPQENAPESVEYEFGYCAPVFTPGLSFWDENVNGEAVCSLGTSSCEYKIVDTLLSDPWTEKGKDCVNTKGDVKQSWIDEAEKKCLALGDCGDKTNYVGKEGSITKFVKKIIAMRDGKNKNNEVKYV